MKTTDLIPLEDDELTCVAGGYDLSGWKPIQIGDININIDIDVNTQINIINFIGNVIEAQGDLMIQLGQQARSAT
ncbi:MAG TPA: hypothetical protein VMF89_23205 [Polyangiales bacterium]|nr:hypothetical protein [Polyangiales bacterium]